MPNHIANILTITGEKADLKTLTEAIKSKENDYVLSFESFFPTPLLCPDSNKWHIINWGTKWDAYEVSKIHKNHKNSIRLSFQTAWSTPQRALVELSRLNPNVELFCEYADEDFGYNLGEYTLKDGQIILENNPIYGTIEAIKLSKDIYERAEELFV